MLLLIDENTYRDTKPASLKNLVAAVFRFEHADNLAVMQDLISLLIDWLGDRPGMSRLRIQLRPSARESSPIILRHLPK